MAVIFGDISAVGGAGSPPAQPKLLSDMRHSIQFDIKYFTSEKSDHSFHEQQFSKNSAKD